MAEDPYKLPCWGKTGFVMTKEPKHFAVWFGATSILFPLVQLGRSSLSFNGQKARHEGLVHSIFLFNVSARISLRKAANAFKPYQHLQRGHQWKPLHY